MSLASSIHALYQQYGQLPGVTIECQNELLAIGIKNKAATAELFLQGAQLTRYQRVNENPILFLSDDCDYKEGLPLRGGIPICWPWFGDLSKNPEQLQHFFSEDQIIHAPAHGFIRDRQWTVESITTPTEQLTVIELSYAVSKEDVFWPYETILNYRIEISDHLSASLSIKNIGDQEFIFSSALHTYFSIDHINKVNIEGFDQSEYIDAVDDWQRKNQQGNIYFTEETDRIYQTGSLPAIIHDTHRAVKVSSTGSQSTVIWNPWIEKSQQLSQFSRDDYLHMLCIETANAVDDIVSLPAGQTHTLSVTIA